MGVLDYLNKGVEWAKRKQTELMAPPKIRICMMGPRQVGKTSILTAIFKNAGDAVIGSNVVFTADDKTILLLEERHNELKDMFYNKKIAERPDIGITASNMLNLFNFNLRINKATLGLEIKDFPGEYLNDNPEEVNTYLQESDAVFIAVDTPHLMECEGKYNEARNAIQQVTDYFKANYALPQNEKLIVFTPLKCEKYYQDGSMDRVTEKVMESYKELISFLETACRGKVACVVAPILTVGGIKFDRFDTDANGAVALLKSGIPKRANYKFCTNPVCYSPQFCEQPLYYLLSFIVKQYMGKKIEPGFWGRLTSLFTLFSEDPSVLLEIKKLTAKRIENKNGYRIVMGKHLI